MTTDSSPAGDKQFCHFCGHNLTRKLWEGRSRLFCPRCELPIYENPVPATAVVVTDEVSGLLLVKRKVAPKKGYWSLPGGFIELHELPEQAALRELEEETGLSGRIENLLGVATHDSAAYGTVLIVGYLVTSFQGKMEAGDDAEAVAFFPFERLPELAFDSHRVFVQTARSAPV
ncbi:MAG: NUDIX hydrolase [Desulfosudaceae bacterium]